MTAALEGRVAVVTGGGAGIGAACARRLARDGATVVITDIDEAAGQATARQFGLGFIPHDVASEDGWGAVVRAVEADYGPLDILVNNAAHVGSSERGSPEDTSLNDLRRVFAVNVEGVFLGCRAAIRSMRSQGAGAIVNVSSIAAFRPTPFLTAYGASKAAVAQFTTTVAQYCAQQGLRIRCNAVYPGVVRTRMWEATVHERAQAHGVSFDEAAAFWTSRIPLGETQSPDDLAAAVAFLASDDARNITGSRIVVDGGMTFA